MKLATILINGQPRVVAVSEKGMLPVASAPNLVEFGASMLAFIEGGANSLEGMARWLDQAPQSAWLARDDTALLAPIPRPTKNLMCLGWNYLAHAAESAAVRGREAAAPADPIVFTKNVTTVNAPYASVVCDPDVTTQLDWEVELAVIIGKRGRCIAEADALNHVFGYTIVNDLSARDLQFRHKQYFIGKSLDGSAPMGPWLVTADEVPDPQALNLTCRVNGVVKQSGSTAQQIFPVARIISLLSRGMTLEPGDIIATGTPEGVGFARTPPEFLRSGDIVECEISGIGLIRNEIVAPG